MFAYCKDTKINARRAVKMKTKPKFSAHTQTQTQTDTLPWIERPSKKYTQKKSNKQTRTRRQPQPRERPLLLSLSLAPPQKHSASTAALSSLTDETGSPKAATLRSSSSNSEGAWVYVCVRVCVHVRLIVNMLFSLISCVHFAFALFFCELFKFVVVAEQA